MLEGPLANEPPQEVKFTGSYFTLNCSDLKKPVEHSNTCLENSNQPHPSLPIGNQFAPFLLNLRMCD
jgi:hypothetical protein